MSLHLNSDTYYIYYICIQIETLYFYDETVNIRIK